MFFSFNYLIFYHGLNIFKRFRFRTRFKFVDNIKTLFDRKLNLK